MADTTGPSTLDLLWLPLGAGQRVVRLSGRVYERLCATRQRRAPQALYHAGLEVTHRGGRYAIELAPVPDTAGADRGVVCEGPVGSRHLARWRVFRYELRCWPGAVIPDREVAVDSPRRLAEDDQQVATLLALLPESPRLVWGRDQLGAGEMWNSNSVIAWLLTRAGLSGPALRPPPGGRAPGWGAGVRLAEAGPQPRWER